MKVLIVEDEKDLACVLSEMLKQEGYIVNKVHNGIDGLDYALTNTYDVIILDIMLPQMNGIEVLKEIRKNGINSSVLLLTAKSEVEDKINGLDNGADDYLTKPFVTKEFLARVRALSRRNNKQYLGNQLTFGDILVDKHKHELIKDTQKIKLSQKEYSILEMLIVNKGNTISKEQFVQKIWGYDTDIEYNSIEVYISFVRRKLNAIHSNVKINTIRSLGYALEVSNG
ncbi:MAG: response regulator transcription factor [Ruminococcus sp.]|nr:response regulator transcription factor [Ruminococcus sp.]